MTKRPTLSYLRRRDIVQKMRAILNRAENENRDLTAREQNDFDALLAQRDGSRLVLTSKLEMIEWMRDSGLAKQTAARLAGVAWPVLEAMGPQHEDEDEQAEADDLAARVSSFAQSLRSKN